ncbi:MULTISPECIES: DUF6479 family protein [Streptomyces]|uniref:DUF6479 family protein n=2 Tax=Streptomyces TaxID=1883 RepID=A0ABV9J2Q3_9ACTN
MTSYEAAAASSAFGVVAVLIGGLVITGALIWAVRLGTKVRRQESRPPRPSEQPTRPAPGTGQDSHERREPNEMPRDGARLTPHELGASGTRRSDDQTRPRWNSGADGSSGDGPGRT